MTPDNFWCVMLERFKHPGIDLREMFTTSRNYSVELAALLSDEDCAAQSMTDASPIKWHLAHTTWFFETFILEKFEADFMPFQPSFRVLFNSYYNGIGENYPRAQRGLLTRPSRGQVLEYRRSVDTRILALLDQTMPAEGSDKLLELVRLGVQHEQQHQELILADIKHLLWLNPLFPAYRDDFGVPEVASAPASWIDFDAGVVEIGHLGDGFHFDNESPRHRQFIEVFSLASALVTNEEYATFIDAGGYEDSSLWLSEGWDWVQTQKLSAPMYWHRDAKGWQEFTLSGLRPLEPYWPAFHLSYFEAAAYAQYAGARLPTEAEWEHAAQTHPLGQMFGVAWQWTSSSYAPYPGFATAPGAIGEYNGKFMVNQYVLRGSSLATPVRHSRATYRNFFPATARWQFSGIRLAR
jgi:ergothioneine biosynthesis protein EgtB